ncbi:MAG: hypothetical protein M0Z55_00500 [Peptococcaceae bacterium]|nr:hypothetical protein [Peptococcaceae bacterium]
MEAFEILIKSLSDGVRFDLYYRPVLIDNIRLSPSDFAEFVERMHQTPQGVVLDYAGYLEPDPERKPKPNRELTITYSNVIETAHGVQFDLQLAKESVKGLFTAKEVFPLITQALRATKLG